MYETWVDTMTPAGPIDNQIQVWIAGARNILRYHLSHFCCCTNSRSKNGTKKDARKIRKKKQSHNGERGKLHRAQLGNASGQFHLLSSPCERWPQGPPKYFSDLAAHGGTDLQRTCNRNRSSDGESVTSVAFPSFL